MRTDNELDVHSCRAEADEYGICKVCGAIVHGTTADYELHGYDPPEPTERELRERKYFTDI